jgi:glycosyltransferase involved in cell wall biosynthesis
MRILLISHVRRDPAAGAASCTLSLAEEWRLQGHTVEDYYIDDIPHVQAGHLTGDLMAVTAARFTLRHLDLTDVLIMTGPLGWMTFELLSRRARRPRLVCLSYGLEHDDWRVVVEEASLGTTRISRLAKAHFRLLVRPAVERSIANADIFIAPRQRHVEQAVARGWKKPHEVYVSAFGIDKAALTVRRQPRFSWGGRVLWCGTTVERKGWTYFRDGFISAKRADPTLTLQLIGTRQSPDSIQSQFPSDMHLTVQPILSRPEQFRLMAGADVFVSTSLSEGYHLALQEAMVIGLPCVATREGFVADTSQPHNLILEIRKRSAEDVSQGIQAVAYSPQLRSNLFIGSSDWARTHTWDTIAQAIISRLQDS